MKTNPSTLAFFIHKLVLLSRSHAALSPPLDGLLSEAICCAALVLCLGFGSARAGEVFWLNPVTGNWSDTSKWSGGLVPDTGDNVYITNNGTYTVTLNVGSTNASLTLGGGSGTQTLLINNRTLNLTGPSVVNPNGALTETFGTLTNTVTLDVSGSLNWSGGVIGGGVVNVKPEGDLNVTAGTGPTLTACTLINGGTFGWGSAIAIDSSAVISNAANGTINLAGNASSGFGGVGIVVNDGQINGDIGAGKVFALGTTFNNNGTVNVDSGTLRLFGGGTTTPTGGFFIGSGATLDLGGLTHELLPGSSVSGPGIFSVSGGIVNIGGSFSVTGNLSFNAGTANFLGDYWISNNIVNLPNGVANFMSVPGATVSPGVLNLGGGTLGATNTVTVKDFTSWSGGTIRGNNTTVHCLGGLTIAGGVGKTLTGCKLVNYSSASTWSGAGSVAMSSGAVFSNAPNGIISITSSVGCGGGTIANAGEFLVMPGNGNTASLNSFFTNHGTVKVQSGSLTIPGGGLSGYVQAAGLTLLNGGIIVNNSSPLRIQAGTLAGTNAVTGGVTNSGTISPGSSPGRLAIGGILTQSAGSALNIELSGTVQGTDYDVLVVTNTAVLSGKLNVSLSNGFLPTLGDTYQIVKFGSRNGMFSSVSGLHCPNGIVLVPRSTSTDLTLAAAQEPLLSTPTEVQNEFQFEVLTTSGFNYQVEYTDSLESPIYWASYGASFSGTGGNITVSYNPITVPHRFFRVQIY